MKQSSSKDFSWGRLYNTYENVEYFDWQKEVVAYIMQKKFQQKYLPVGLGRSYGDSCLNSEGSLLQMSGLSHILMFDKINGVLRCEAGISFEEILQIIVPQGWFLPVTPGTMKVTLGGAIANDVHGKNHHVAGTFGCHITKMCLLRSDVGLIECDMQKNSDYFKATIGGLGLTGVILWAEFKLKKITSHLIQQDIIKFKNLQEFIKIDQESKHLPYTVSWIDSLANGDHLARGLYIRGDHCQKVEKADDMKFAAKHLFNMPIEAPAMLLNPLTVRMFNFAYYNKQLTHGQSSVTGIQNFFYPLDAVDHWNKFYGKPGFRQFQFVLPNDKVDVLANILEQLAQKGYSSFLTVLKKFGEIESPGWLSFPKAGYTVAMDIPNRSKEVDEFLLNLTDKIIDQNGRLYPAKDSLMREEHFKNSYQYWQKFCKCIDPNINSNFWNRVVLHATKK